MKKKRILVFPCGSEIGLEVNRSMRFSNHFELVGASSIEDHGSFAFDRYIGNVSNIEEESFARDIQKLIRRENIDAIYPTMDSVILRLIEIDLGVPIISSPKDTARICGSKTKTLDCLREVVKVPTTYCDIEEVRDYPIFIRPDSGYGSRGAKKIDDKRTGEIHIQELGEEVIIQEFLNGAEYTVDCFTDRRGELLFSGIRKRARIRTGISVQTCMVNELNDFSLEMALKINSELSLRGAWFFQLKENAYGELHLLEVACRLGGSSSLYRQQGINFALMSAFDALDVDVNICRSEFDVVLDRALESRFKTNIEYQVAYIDFDDCVILNGKIVLPLISFLFNCINKDRRIILITKHAGDIKAALERHRLNGLFDEIIHLQPRERKADHIVPEGAIFIDDSYVERMAVKSKLGIPVFSVDAIECLLD